MLNGNVVKYGATSQQTEGKVESIDCTVVVDDGTIFRHQYRVAPAIEGDPPLSLGGDSGSAVLDSEHYAIGLVMAGDGVRFSIVNPIGQITTALGIRV